jgi:diaminohydroxyphosphoribosylaminopyrimidine deaminase/5-amino-6-(5-phosphoribosylamino)uracil reductase
MNVTAKNSDELYMQRCIQLAGFGMGNVSTNPLVGCVIVHKDKIVGEGYHKQFGGAHAEVNAINSVEDKSILPECTLYVNLEPCAHYGKTPPCADLIAKHRLKSVVIGTVDTFSEVAGKGIEKLKHANIGVFTGILEDECRHINRRFFCYNEKKRPYIILKWAQTVDGFIGRNKGGINLSKRISNSYTDIKVHQWRTEEDAILVGTNTALQDNPLLTSRNWQGKNPTRVLIDYELKVPETYSIYNNEAKTIVINAEKSEEKGSIVYAKVDDKTIESILAVMFKHKIQSVIVEGGAKMLQSFIDAGLWDEARVIQSKAYWGDGIKSPEISGEVLSREVIKSDSIRIIVPKA